MNKLKKVIRVEMRTEVDETTEAKRHDYSRGGYKLEEKINRITTMIPAALLECGHWRKENSSRASVSTAKRLFCYECDWIERERNNAKS